MVIVFGNQKGGAGKSTLATLFANTLSIAKKREILVLDMDYQRTIYFRYKEDQMLENIEPYEVMELDLENYPKIYPALKNKPDQITIIDLPGRLDDKLLIPVLQTADVFIIPFHYDKNTYNSTNVFNFVTNKLNPNAKKFFVPNRVKQTVRHETEEQINAEFSQFGIVTSKIPDSVIIQRTTTKDINPKVIPLINDAFEEIFKVIL